MKYNKYDYNELLKLDGDELLKAAGVPYKEIDKDNNEFFHWLVTSEVLIFIQTVYNGDYIREDPLTIKIYYKILDALKKHMEQSKTYGWKCPKEGEFYGYKAVILDRYTRKSKFEFGIVKLRIPKEAKRVSPFLADKKCRCDMAFVEEIRRVEVVREEPIVYKSFQERLTLNLGKRDYTMNYKTDEDGTILKATRGLSIYNKNFEYAAGKIVQPHLLRFDDNPWIECSNGIHFFMDEKDALWFGEQNLVL